MTADFTLSYFNATIAEKKFSKAMELLIHFLNKIEDGHTFVPAHLEQEFSADEQTKMYTHFAAAIINLLSNPELILTEALFFELIRLKRNMEVIFQLSMFQTSDIILQNAKLLDLTTQKITFNNQSDFYKILFCIGLNSVVNIDYRLMLLHGKMPVLATYFSQLANIIHLNDLSHAKYISLLKQMDIIDMIDYLENMSFLSMISIIWMSCSYLPQPDKHVIKFKINGLIQRTFKKWNLNTSRKIAPKNKKPRILVVLDVFTSNHAMYRCYARTLADLSQQHELAVIVEKGKIDQAGKQFFAKIIETQPNVYDFITLLSQIRKINPDIIFYPSLGMSNLGIWLANLRLAPIQIVGMGHPASSFISTVDFVLMEETLYHPLAPMSEKIVLVPDGSFEYLPHPDHKELAMESAFTTELIKIAIPCNLLKITHDFLSVCQEIQQAASQKIEFHFFPNLQGAHYHLVTKMINALLPDAIIHPRIDYARYLVLLKQCHFAISTFPFGGTNSTVDALQSGLPLVTLEGFEPHNRSDSICLRLLNADSRLITANRAEFKQMILQLIQDPILLSQLRSHAKGLPFERLIKNSDAAASHFFTKLFDLMYTKMDFLTASDHRVVPLAALQIL